jgi:hypothetical protein
MTVGRRTSLQDAVRRFDGTGKPRVSHLIAARPPIQGLTNKRGTMNDKRVKGPDRNGQQAKTKLARSSRKRDGQAAADDRRLDAELADSFPASDPPSILRRGNP